MTKLRSRRRCAAAVRSLTQVWPFGYAPVFIIVLGDPRTIDAYPARTKLEKWESHFYSSLANCVLQLMLAAHALGLTTIYISDVSSPYFSVMIKSLLDVPDPLQVYQLVPVGFAEESPTIHHPRRALKDMVHYEKYDPALFAVKRKFRTSWRRCRFEAASIVSEGKRGNRIAGARRAGGESPIYGSTGNLDS